MGVKTRSRLLALLVALVMVFTSAVGVFAASSPSKGKKASKAKVKSTVYVSKRSIKVKTTGKYKYKINNGKWKTTKKKTIKKIKKGSRVTIKTKKGTTYRWMMATKITKARKGNLRWKKVKGAKYYMVKITKKGKTTWKKVKGTKLKKGVTKGAKVSVRPVKVYKGKAYLGAITATKKIKK